MAEDTNDYVLPSSDSEVARLELQANLYGGMEFLEAALSEAPKRVLEVGCGTGYFSRQVASRLPKSEVVGLDLDESRLAYAREHSGTPNLEFRLGDLGALPFEDDTFDLVFSRFAMVHYPEPVDALRRGQRCRTGPAVS